MGQKVERIDAREKVTGKSVYVGDMKLAGMLYGKVLRSPLAHARIRRIDGRAAAAMPGVMTVLTRENVPAASPYYGSHVTDQGIVAVEKVRYTGDVVAAVAAVDKGIAEEALSKVEVEYDPLPVVETVEEALAEGAPLVHEEMRGRREPKYGRGGSFIGHEGSNICLHFRYERGEIERGFAEAEFILEDTFYFPSTQHHPLEPHISLANFDGNNLTVWSSTQSPFTLRQELSHLFTIPLSRVRVIVSYLGGGFGAKDGIRTEALSVALCRLAGRPVQVAFDGDEAYRTVCQSRAIVKMKTGVKKDGTFIARKSEVYLDTGAYANNSTMVCQKAAYRAHGPYRIPHVSTDAYCVYTNTVPAASFRGFGAPHVAFAYESHLDMLAYRLRLDPLELRLKNLLEKGEEYSPGDTLMDCDLKGRLREVAQAIGWRKEEEGSDKGKGPGIRRGKGIACAVKDGGGGPPKPAHAMVKILNDGSASLSFGSVEMGQGIRTALLQVVAEELGISAENVRVPELDTLHTPFDRGTNASSAVSGMGQAVLKAARDARAQLISAVARVLGVEEELVRLEGGRVVSRQQAFSVSEAMELCFGQTQSEIVGRGFIIFTPTDQVPLGYLSPFWEIGIGGAEVEVDEMTGDVRVVKYVSLTDAGRMLHPLHCRGQNEGAAVFGLGLSLFEELSYEDGQLMNPNLVDYRLPRFRDLPREFRTTVVEEGGGPGPYGAKGLGEGGILPVAPAICNAVYDAVGVRIREVPLKGERVWRAVLAKGDK